MKKRSALQLLHHDMLCHTFSFLDYSHVATLSCVCKEWEQIANSNQLWEFYFHLLSNNKKGRTQISSTILSDDELFWKCKIRHQFSKYSCRVSKSIAQLLPSTASSTDDSGTGGHQLEFSALLKQTFPDALSSQLVKMILSRMCLDSITCGKNFQTPFVKINNFDEIAGYVSYHYRLRLRIGGFTEPLVFRWTRYTGSLNLFGYEYANSYYLYFAKECDDKLNEEDFKPLHTYNRKEVFDKLDARKSCFMYQFTEKNKAGRICGEEYLVNEILSVLVPTLRDYELSPKQFVPYWCLLFSILSGQFDEYGIYWDSKEFLKHYPNLALNRLCFHYLRTKSLHEVKELSKNISTKLEQVGKKFNNEGRKRVFTSLDLSIPLSKHTTYNAATEDLYCLVLRASKYLCSRCEPGQICASKYLGPHESGQRTLFMKRLYKLLFKQNLEELADLYLTYKFKQPYQIVTQ